ncbi:MAG: THUMP domain-containing protein [Candidatus Diapherotrites archaeon]
MLVPDCILVKTASEISLKSTQVRRFFVKKLVQNIRLALKKNGIAVRKIERKGGRLYLFADDLEKAFSLLRFTFGVHAIALAEEHKKASLESIAEKALAAAKGFLREGDSFAVRASRNGEHDFSSKDIEIFLGRELMNHFPKLKVNLSTPAKEVFVEVQQDSFYIFFSELRCSGGLPLGVEGSVAVLFEGKEEDLLAAWLLMKRGCNVFPIAKKRSKKILAQLRQLEPWNSFREFSLTEEKHSKKLFSEKKIKALVKADRELKSDFKKSDEKQALPVLRPLVFYPEEFFNEKMQLIGESA